MHGGPWMCRATLSDAVCLKDAAALAVILTEIPNIMSLRRQIQTLVLSNLKVFTGPDPKQTQGTPNRM